MNILPTFALNNYFVSITYRALPIPSLPIRPTIPNEHFTHICF